MSGILYGKFGKRIKVAQEHSIGNGDFDALHLLKLLAIHFPNQSFYVMSPNDIDILTDEQYQEAFPNENVFNEFQRNEYAQQLMVKTLRNKKFYDLGIFLGGPRSYLAKEKSQLGIVNMLNDSPNFPWIEVVHDNRFRSAKNSYIKNQPVFSLGQSDTGDTMYQEMEYLYLFQKVPQEVHLHKIKEGTSGITMICNPGNDDWRRSRIEKYIFDKFDDVKVIGTWADALTDSRFKPPIPHDGFQNYLRHFRYTLVIPIIPGFATAKYVEMLHHNIIPFFHPDFDNQGNVKKLPEFLRVTSPNDFYSKIHHCNEHPEYALQLLFEAKRDLLDFYWYSGKRMADIFQYWIEEITQKNIDQGEKNGK